MSDTAFIVDLEGFEGPLDLLLDLARAHKVDLARISILDLAEQFLAYLRNLQAQPPVHSAWEAHGSPISPPCLGVSEGSLQWNSWHTNVAPLAVHSSFLAHSWQLPSLTEAL